MSCVFGNRLKITIFGQSRSQATGVVIDGLPAGMKIDFDKLSSFTSRRRAGRYEPSTTRREPDEAKILCGIFNGRTCGTPLCAVIENRDAESENDEKTRFVPRPSHADYASYMKRGGFNDYRGGGNSSGRLTAPLCFAGAVCAQFLEIKGIYIGAHLAGVGKIYDDRFDPTRVCKEDFEAVRKRDYPVINEKKGALMKSFVVEAAAKSDSAGGLVECAAIGVKAGTGEPIFDGLKSKISAAVFSVPSINGVEFGSGFSASELLGSENNDPFVFENGEVKTLTNNCGGVLGGMSSGAPIIFRCSIKPAPSVGIPQKSVNLKTGKPETLLLKGRYDPCVAPRAVVCIEAATAIALADCLI